MATLALTLKMERWIVVLWKRKLIMHNEGPSNKVIIYLFSKYELKQSSVVEKAMFVCYIFLGALKSATSKVI